MVQKVEIREGEEQDNPCANVKPMEKWVSEPSTDTECRPCLLGPVAQWYRDELVERGHSDMANRIGTLVKRSDLTPEELCRELDHIKQEVPEELRQRLLDFDCSAQCYTKNQEKEETDGQD